jgi:hypothetical protein
VLAANVFYSSMSREGIDASSRLALLPSCALVGGAVLVAGRLRLRYRGDLRVLPVLLLLFLPSANLVDGVKDTVQEGFITYTLDNDADALRNVLALIPADASVAAPGYALPALANRATLFNLPQLHMYPKAPVDYILLDRDLDRVTTSPELQPRYAVLLERLAHSKEYETVWEKGPYALLRRIGNGKND